MIRLVGRVILIVAGLLFCLPFHYAWKLLRRPSPWPRRFLWWVGRASGVRATINGTPLPSQVLFLANHLSWLDIMVLAGASGTAFVSKDEVGRWPVLGWLARLNNTVFIARSDRKSVRGQADALRAALASGQPVALFPEGTTEGGTDVLPFRASLLQSLFPPLPDLKVQPVALDYGDAGEEIAWTGEERAGANARRVLSRPGTIQALIHFLEPIEPANLGDRKSLAERARSEILVALASAPAADRL
ncbi:MAG TPA: lysophospholipid acyltransferase family protein [Allosphingosinicella sp.]|jgi:1-acyl-sn-glycerol-3-phosphate acyltransferase|uniref:lysophospholipid acyltransferase family protein n=1 Tax=Allosphingosinicella sp. TaxID=2823234 RepID=UPI002F29DFAF